MPLFFSGLFFCHVLVWVASSCRFSGVNVSYRARRVSLRCVLHREQVLYPSSGGSFLQRTHCAGSAAFCAMVVALSLCDAVCIGCRYENIIAPSLVIIKPNCCVFLVVLYEIMPVLDIRLKRGVRGVVIYHHHYYSSI
jgi:hypothetical protein